MWLVAIQRKQNWVQEQVGHEAPLSDAPSVPRFTICILKTQKKSNIIRTVMFFNTWKLKKLSLILVKSVLDYEIYVLPYLAGVIIPCLFEVMVIEGAFLFSSPKEKVSSVFPWESKYVVQPLFGFQNYFRNWISQRNPPIWWHCYQVWLYGKIYMTIGPKLTGKL